MRPTRHEAGQAGTTEATGEGGQEGWGELFQDQLLPYLRTVLQGILSARDPPPVPPRPPCAVGDRPRPGFPAPRLPGRDSRLLKSRSGPGACSLLPPGSPRRLLTAALVCPGGPAGVRAGADEGRRRRGGGRGAGAAGGGGRTSQPRPAAATQHPRLRPPRGEGSARPGLRRGRVLQGPGGCGRRPRRGLEALRGPLRSVEKLSGCRSRS